MNDSANHDPTTAMSDGGNDPEQTEEEKVRQAGSFGNIRQDLDQGPIEISGGAVLSFPRGLVDATKAYGRRNGAWPATG